MNVEEKELGDSILSYYLYSMSNPNTNSLPVLLGIYGREKEKNLPLGFRKSLHLEYINPHVSL